MNFYQYYHFYYYSKICSCCKFKRCWRENRKKKSEITEKDHLKRRVTFTCGWDDIGGNRMKLVSYKMESERPGVQPSGDWQEPRRKRKGHWSWDKWFRNKQQKREQVRKKTQGSIEERARAEHTVLMGMTLVRGQRGPQHQRALSQWREHQFAVKEFLFYHSPQILHLPLSCPLPSPSSLLSAPQPPPSARIPLNMYFCEDLLVLNYLSFCWCLQVFLLP